jgi:Fe-S cluster assembly protein SufD
MVATVQVEVPHTLYEQAFRNRLQGLLTDSADWLQDFRLQALSRFETLGFPTRRLEAWKHINIRPLLNQSFQPCADAVAVSDVELQPHLLSNPPAGEHSTEILRLVFVNGYYREDLSSSPAALDAAALDVQKAQTAESEHYVGSIKAATQGYTPKQSDGKPQGQVNTQIEFLKTQLGRQISEENDAFAALNAALFEDGALIRVPDGVTVQPLLQILFLSTGSSEPYAAYPRNLVILGRNAKVSLLIEHIGLCEEPYFNSSVNEFILSEGAIADVTVLFSESNTAWHLAATRTHLAESAQLNLSTITVSGKTLRHSISTLLQGEKAEVGLHGLDVLRGATEMYHHTVTEHWVPNCASSQFYKGILDDTSKSEFNGMVFVAQGANGTDSQQLNKNLLLSDEARVWTRPQLQINADDVKCAHGATVGQLEKEQLFYLASRGLDRELAKSLLTYGFAEEIITRLENPAVRRYLDRLILDNLRGSENGLRQELGV